MGNLNLGAIKKLILTPVRVVIQPHLHTLDQELLLLFAKHCGQHRKVSEESALILAHTHRFQSSEKIELTATRNQSKVK